MNIIDIYNIGDFIVKTKEDEGFICTTDKTIFKLCVGWYVTYLMQ